MSNYYQTGSTAKNNGGSAINVGHSTTLEQIDLGSSVPSTGSVVVDGDNTDPALSSGDFAHNNVKPIALKVTTELATIPNSVLLSAASSDSDHVSIHKIESVITRRVSTAIRSGYWDLFHGVFTSDPVVATDTFHKAISGATYIDSVANASRSNKGKVIYLSGSKLPTVNSYGN